jgi:DDE superfamily endonuclease
VATHAANSYKGKSTPASKLKTFQKCQQISKSPDSNDLDDSGSDVVARAYDSRSKGKSVVKKNSRQQTSKKKKVNALKLTNIKLIYLPPNTTAHLQPLDAGVINNFKVSIIVRQFVGSFNSF